jgi:hypothetical protein
MGWRLVRCGVCVPPEVLGNIFVELLYVQCVGAAGAFHFNLLKDSFYFASL